MDKKTRRDWSNRWSYEYIPPRDPKKRISVREVMSMDCP